MHDRCMVTRSRSRSSGVDSRVGIDYRHRGACCASRRKKDMQATGAAEAVVASYRDTVHGMRGCDGDAEPCVERSVLVPNSRSSVQRERQRQH